MAEDYVFWCYLKDDPNIFRVTISPTKDVFELKKVIHETKLSMKYRVVPADVILTKVHVGLYENIVEAGQYQPGPNDVPLHPAVNISDIWPTPPSKSFIHVFVSIATSTVLGKRARSVDEFEFIKQSKLFRMAPSQLGKSIEYKSLQQNPSERILDDRPEQDSVPPASLLYEGFGHFLDIFRSHEDFCDLTPERRKLELAVNAFAEAMTTFFTSEAERRTKGLDALNAILSLEGRRELTAANVDSSRICSYGHYNGPHEAISCIVGFKNELVDITSIPLVELAGYVAHSHAQSIQSHKELYMSWRVPCLGLTIVGPYVTFYAVVFFRQLRVVSLTPTLSCVTSAGEGDDRKALYAAFDGALALLRRIDKDTQDFVNIPPNLKISYEDRKLPYVLALPKYNAPGEIRFRILLLHPDEQDYRLLYVARTLDEKEERIMVKFARRYSIELHAFCAERGQAPAIRGFNKIPGGWFVIAMECISPPMPASRSPKLQSLFDRWTEELQELVQSFHDAGFVHGDLREPNILCFEDTLKLIDFDWGGVVGEACYPHARLCSELTDGRDGADPKITKGDDKRVLQNTLEIFKIAAYGT